MISALIVAYIAYVFVGILSGLLSVLLGISGGLITVPCLFAIFYFLDYPQAYLMHLAIGTSLAAMVFNSFYFAWVHNRDSMVLWDIFKMMVPGAILGAIAGAYLASLFSGIVLELLFGVGAVLLGARFLFTKRKWEEGEHPITNFTKLSGAGFLISAVSNLLGVGGGMFIVPTLLYFRVGEQKVIGTTAAVSFVISFLGAASYLYFGRGATSIEYTLGYINLPAFIVIGAVSFFAVRYGLNRYGLKFIQKSEPGVARKFFGGALMITGLLMLFL